MSWLPVVDDADEPYGEYADVEVRQRPNPKANRPRTKRRPEHADAVVGMVTGVDRGRYQVLVSGPGSAPAERMASFDKQIVRDWLAAAWDQTGTPPELPAEIVERTAAKYRELLEKLTA